MTTFEDLDLIGPLRRSLKEENYSRPTEIQAKTIPAAVDGYDILGCAPTGTGKTAAFALPILNELGSRNRRAIPGQPFALVLAPTRELAIQIGDNFDTYGRHLRLRKTIVFGGVNQTRQVKAIERGCHLMIATPGRLLDLMNQGHIDLRSLEMFVLDEADRMLDMGFLPDLKRIISCLPEERQSLFFSATLPPNIVKLSESLLYEPIAVTVKAKKQNANHIKQKILFVEKGERLKELKEILSAEDVRRVIVFTRTKRSANTLERKLKRDGFKAGAIHGDKSQPSRQKTLEAFRQKRVQVLVATDVAARGIDVDGITHVINYDLPSDPESYVHRIGRTGRAGAEGIAVTFCGRDQLSDLRAIEKFVGRRLTDGPERDAAPAPAKKKPRPNQSRGPFAKRSKRKPPAESNASRARRSKLRRQRKPASQSS